MAEGSGLLNRRRGQTLPRVRIPVSPLVKKYFFLTRFIKCFNECNKTEIQLFKIRREVVQLGRIFGLGPRGRRFESCPPDYIKKAHINW